MKLALLLLSLIFHAAAAVVPHADGDRASLIATARDQIRLTQAFMTLEDMKQDALERSGESLTCDEQSDAYYNNTALMPADFFTLLAGGAFSDPSFDLQGFFDTIQFDSVCESYGGEVYGVDISINCGGGASIVEDFKLCKPPICHEFEYVLYRMLMYAFVGAFFGCEIELLSDAATSMACLSGIQEIYNNTALTDASPENFFASGGTQYIEQAGFCKEYSKNGDVKVCYTKKLQPEYDDGIAACSLLGGSDIYMDLTIDVPYYHRSFLRYPYCKHSACTNDEISVYYDYISYLASGGNLSEEEKEQLQLPDIKMYLSPDNGCEEFVSEKALMKKTAGSALAKSCKWLKKRPEDLKKKFCSKSFSLDGFDPAQTVCPATCCKCVEDGGDVFLKKTELGSDGSLIIVTETCDWLSGITESNRNMHCTKTGASYIGGFPPAGVACPQTCGTCS